jgi:ABC-type amino acid transport substrate-binding protein
MTADVERRLHDDPTGDPPYVTGRIRAMLLDRPVLARPRPSPRGLAGNGLRLAVTVLIAAMIVAALVVIRGSRPPDNAVIASPSPAPTASETPTSTPTPTATPTPSRTPTVAPAADRLAQIQAAGVIRIAVRPTQPEYHVPGAKGTFDEAVATELGKRLGITVELVHMSTADMLADTSGTAWDVALPSTASWVVPPAFATSSPYYYWPHFLLATRGSQNPDTDAAIAAGPVCAVAGDLGEHWLRGTYGATASAPLTRQVVTRPTEPDCFALVKAGQAAAAVTANETYVELNCRFSGCTNGSCSGAPCPAELLQYREAPPEPRPAIVPQTGPDSASLVGAVNAAFDAMRADHTLTGFVRAQFGNGRDVSFEKDTGFG